MQFFKQFLHILLYFAKYLSKIYLFLLFLYYFYLFLHFSPIKLTKKDFQLGKQQFIYIFFKKCDKYFN